MEPQTLISKITTSLKPHPEFEALFLAGSHGKNTADVWSDIDLVALAAPENHAHCADTFRQTLEQITPIVHWMDRRFASTLLNAVTQDWQRIDLYIIAPNHFTNRAQNTLKPLIDPTNIHETPPTTLAPSQPDPKAIHNIITEFFRVLGLLPVVLGRGELLTALWGVNLQRDAVQNLMLQTCPVPDKGGALHLSKLLTTDQKQTLESLPTPTLDRDALIAAQITIAQTFLPLARQLARDTNIDWPDTFEAATRHHLKSTLDLTF